MAGGGGRPCSPQQALLGMVAIMAVVVEARQGAPGGGSEGGRRHSPPRGAQGMWGRLRDGGTSREGPSALSDSHGVGKGLAAVPQHSAGGAAFSPQKPSCFSTHPMKASHHHRPIEPGEGGKSRQQEPARSEQTLLSVIFFILLPAARAAPEEDQLSVGFFRKNVVYGNIRHAENVYVKMFTNSPTLVCMDLSLSQEEIIDPKYSWTGPDGRNLEGQGYANLTGSGELVLLGFQESMSGSYTCALSHRIIETSAQEEIDVTDTYRFMVYAYREANHVYQVSVRFTAKGCELAANARFVEELKKIMENLISDLACRVERLSHRCHSLEAPHRGSPSELFITFQGNGSRGSRRSAAFWH